MSDVKIHIIDGIFDKKIVETIQDLVIALRTIGRIDYQTPLITPNPEIRKIILKAPTLRRYMVSLPNYIKMNPTVKNFLIGRYPYSYGDYIFNLSDNVPTPKNAFEEECLNFIKDNTPNITDSDPEILNNIRLYFYIKRVAIGIIQEDRLQNQFSKYNKQFFHIINDPINNIVTGDFVDVTTGVYIDLKVGGSLFGTISSKSLRKFSKFGIYLTTNIAGSEYYIIPHMSPDIADYTGTLRFRPIKNVGSAFDTKYYENFSYVDSDEFLCRMDDFTKVIS